MRKLWIGTLFLGLAGVVAAGISGCGSSSVSAGSPSKGINEPSVTFKDLQGNSVPLASLKGKVVLVNFWETSCEPCIGETPTLIGLQQKYASQGFTILGVAMDDEGKSVVAPFVQQTQFDVNGQKKTMDYPILLGSDDIASQFGGLIGYPTSFLISRDGKIQKKYLGMLNGDQIQKEVQSLL